MGTDLRRFGTTPAVIICAECRAHNPDGTRACRACGQALTGEGTGRGQPPKPVLGFGETVVAPRPEEERIAEEVRRVEERFTHEVASLQKELEDAKRSLAQAVADTAKGGKTASSDHVRAVEARVAEEVAKIQSGLADEAAALRNALARASARADEAEQRLADGGKGPAPSRSNGLLLPGSIAILAVALLLFVFRPQPEPPTHHYPVRYEQLEKQLSDAHDAANGYQVRIAALQDQVAALRKRLKDDDTRVETLRSEVADAEARPSAASDPSQAATIQSLRKKLAAEQDQLAAARTAFVNVQHSRDEALARLRRTEEKQ